MTSRAAEWDDAYRGAEAPPWDIGKPQPVVAALAADGLFSGAVLDAGCGTGEHALLAASYGASVLGVDLSAAAIARAQEKAGHRGLDARFEAGDILMMSLPESGFDVVLDSGLFHSFDDGDRERYVARLTEATRAGGRCCLMCFSDRQPGDWGPRRVTRAELETSFGQGWSVERLEPATFEINPLPAAQSVHAWLGVFRRG